MKIALLPGDGIGPEIVGEAVKVLDSVAAKYGHQFEYSKALVGACAIDATGDPYPAETHAVCEASDVVLFGAIGDPKYDNNPAAKVRPEQGLLRMRKSLGLFANLRPLAVFDSLAGRSPLKTEIVKGADFICVRELTGGMYFGRPQGRSEDGNTAYDTCVYTREEIERILHLAFGLARGRRKKLTLVDKANVIATSRLWRQIGGELAPQYPDVELEYMFVDNAAMQLVRDPSQFDVILTGFDAAQKIKVIKVIREVMGLGLAEAKAAVEGAPTTMKEGLSKEDAEALKKQVEEVGGKVELK